MYLFTHKFITKISKKQLTLPPNIMYGRKPNCRLQWVWQSTGGGAAVLVLFPAIQKIDDLNIDCFLIFLTVHKVEIFGGLTVIGQELSLRIQEENVEQGCCFFYFLSKWKGGRLATVDSV